MNCSIESQGKVSESQSPCIGTRIWESVSLLVSAGREWGYTISGDMINGLSSSTPERTELSVPKGAFVKLGDKHNGLLNPEIGSGKEKLFVGKGVVDLLLCLRI